MSLATAPKNGGASTLASALQTPTDVAEWSPQKSYESGITIYTFVNVCMRIYIYYIILYYIILYYIILHYIILYYIILYDIILYYMIWYYIILYYIIPYHIILYYIILYYIILYIYIIYIYYIYILYIILRKPASWIVAVCEQSEYKGVWGEGLPKWAKISLLLGGKGVFWERFSGSCTMRQKGDCRVSIPPRSAFWGAFWGAWQRSRCLLEGGRSASTDRKGKGKGAFCHCCRCWWRKDKSRPARGSLSGTVLSVCVKEEGGLAASA